MDKYLVNDVAVSLAIAEISSTIISEKTLGKAQL
jgi:hypothetical protein